MAFGEMLRFLRKRSNDPRYLVSAYGEGSYFELLDEAFRSIDYRKTAAFIDHMYTELGHIHCPGPVV